MMHHTQPLQSDDLPVHREWVLLQLQLYVLHELGKEGNFVSQKISQGPVK
jgi:hypothetical protein